MRYPAINLLHGHGLGIVYVGRPCRFGEALREVAADPGRYDALKFFPRRRRNLALGGGGTTGAGQRLRRSMARAPPPRRRSRRSMAGRAAAEAQIAAEHGGRAAAEAQIAAERGARAAAEAQIAAELRGARAALEAEHGARAAAEAQIAADLAARGQRLRRSVARAPPPRRRSRRCATRPPGGSRGHCASSDGCSAAVEWSSGSRRAAVRLLTRPGCVMVRDGSADLCDWVHRYSVEGLEGLPIKRPPERSRGSPPSMNVGCLVGPAGANLAEHGAWRCALAPDLARGGSRWPNARSAPCFIDLASGGRRCVHALPV